MGWWEWMCEWMSLRCHSCAQTLDRGERCLGPDLHCPRLRHQAPRVRVTRSQPGELLKPGRKGLLWRLLEKPLLPAFCCCCICWTHLQMFCQYCPSRWVLKSICQAFWPSPTTTLDRKRTTNRRRHVWWVEFFALCYFRSVHGWIG